MWLVIISNLIWQFDNEPQTFVVDFAVYNVVTTTTWVDAPEMPGWQKLEPRYTCYVSFWDITFVPFGPIRMPIFWNRGYVRGPPSNIYSYYNQHHVIPDAVYFLETDFDWEYQNRGIYLPLNRYPDFP